MYKYSINKICGEILIFTKEEFFSGLNKISRISFLSIKYLEKCFYFREPGRGLLLMVVWEKVLNIED